ncbi:MAG: alpha/beta fold hydrolase [Bryobacteraceae bacterium]|nr:alpha/beta fold hydrolase [Bryobacteraceae bacterium]
MNIVVLAALDPQPEPDPLFAFAGGPGQAAGDGAAGDAQRFAAIRGKRDIVLIDQRGTGRSNPLPCDLGSPQQIMDAFAGGSFHMDVVKRCLEKLQAKADLRYYTTPLAVDDADEVRAWLGYDKVNTYGGSYGTRPALLYARQYPDRVRSVTLRAVSAHTDSLVLHMAKDSQTAWDRLVADCAKDSACAAAFPDLNADLAAVLARLEKEPAKVPLKGPQGNAEPLLVTRDILAGSLRRALGDSGNQAQIPAMMQVFRAGNFDSFARMLQQNVNLVGSLTLGLNISITCSEDGDALTPEAIARETKGTFQGPAMAASLREVCAVWPKAALPARYHQPVKSDVPVLLLSGTLDPQTPVHWARKVASTLPNSRLVLLEGIAHGPFPRCAQDIMARFVAAGSARDLDTACTAGLRRPPFAVPEK